MSIDTQSDVLVAAVDSLNAIAKDLAAFTNRTARSPGHSKVYIKYLTSNTFVSFF